MSIKSERSTYQVLEENLKEPTRPLTCNELWDMDGRIRELEKEGGPNKVSDLLGFMWRKGLLIRFNAPKTSTSFARYAYQWKEDKPDFTEKFKAPEPPQGALTNLKVKEVKDGVRIEINGFAVTIQKS
jgi:hypothetical protein